MAKYLDETGLSHFWGKIKSYIDSTVGGSSGSGSKRIFYIESIETNLPSETLNKILEDPENTLIVYSGTILSFSYSEENMLGYYGTWVSGEESLLETIEIHINTENGEMAQDIYNPGTLATEATFANIYDNKLVYNLDPYLPDDLGNSDIGTILTVHTIIYENEHYHKVYMNDTNAVFCCFNTELLECGYIHYSWPTARNTLYADWGGGSIDSGSSDSTVIIDLTASGDTYEPDNQYQHPDQGLYDRASELGIRGVVSFIDHQYGSVRQAFFRYMDDINRLIAYEYIYADEDDPSIFYQGYITIGYGPNIVMSERTTVNVGSSSSDASGINNVINLTEELGGSINESLSISTDTYNAIYNNIDNVILQILFDDPDGNVMSGIAYDGHVESADGSLWFEFIAEDLSTSGTILIGGSMFIQSDGCTGVDEYFKHDLRKQAQSFNLLSRKTLGVNGYVDLSSYMDSYNDLMIIVRGTPNASTTYGISSSTSGSSGFLTSVVSSSSSIYLKITMHKTDEGYYAWDIIGSTGNLSSFGWSTSTSYKYLRNYSSSATSNTMSVVIHGR